MPAQPTATARTYAGLFTVALATLMYEILLTRIFSVTMWYHFAFMAISIAMFGMTAGAVIVFLRPRYFVSERAPHQLALSSLLFGTSIVGSFLAHLWIPFIPHKSGVGLFSMGLTYAVIAVPFVFSGICVCLALSRFPQQVSGLYAADLLGAALGCILTVCALRLTDGPTAVILVACLASAAALLFAGDIRPGRLRRAALGCTIGFAGFVVVHSVLVAQHLPFLRLVWVKGVVEQDRPLYEKWNSFSRVRVHGDPNRPEAAFGWGLSSTLPPDRRLKQLGLQIDASAWTVLTAFTGNLDDVEHLKYDVTNIAHYLRHDASVLVIGAGGGRDILSALVFGQRAIRAVEINEDIILAVNGVYGDFTGHLDKHPAVTFVNDEARSYVARAGESFDLIHISLIDTWAATAAGAFVLTENTLYTREAWSLFLAHLTPRGILSVSRWYHAGRPDETYRLASLATAALLARGVREPRRHLAIVANIPRLSSSVPRVATLLLSRGPLSTADVETLEHVSDRLEFEVILNSRRAGDPTLEALTSENDRERVMEAFPVNIEAPTDDSPFFFHMLRLRSVLTRAAWADAPTQVNMNAVLVLAALLLIVVALTGVCIVVPLAMSAEKGSFSGLLPLSTFFACIGFGFMLVEVSQMQRLIVFLGHPTYGLSVVLFSLLASSGAGSYSTRHVSRTLAPVLLGVLVAALLVFGVMTPSVITAFRGATTPTRILVAVGLLLPVGLFMGMAFPFGMTLAALRSPTMTPWLWGINGATSVCASVLAVAIALTAGISTALWFGVGFYAVALVSFVWADRSPGASLSTKASRAPTPPRG